MEPLISNGVCLMPPKRNDAGKRAALSKSLKEKTPQNFHQIDYLKISDASLDASKIEAFLKPLRELRELRAKGD
jgi:hypothetical protein